MLELLMSLDETPLLSLLDPLSPPTLSLSPANRLPRQSSIAYSSSGFLVAGIATNYSSSSSSVSLSRRLFGLVWWLLGLYEPCRTCRVVFSFFFFFFFPSFSLFPPLFVLFLFFLFPEERKKKIVHYLLFYNSSAFLQVRFAHPWFAPPPPFCQYPLVLL
ncbi:hypothetical protein ASPWEDRAFT_704316 [Aspergillus wentii DTO 134E9]|uniref:Uncharacterized protein n=1 Tax=Aspergillus wentii DTO 134E9 TaxID=1073089 RepID=A0A1L9R5U3_ASPWE|nr:uncharacterized protein ASPWEDRAFT_704316 [Aspergillus wentii DTO 134E9]OJJ30284.1 hypothetical protein ASPWEDRAFT_704316 [Aspergillus wentii DTO 134E9]